MIFVFSAFKPMKARFASCKLRFLQVLCAITLLASTCEAESRPVVALLTDFGLANEAVGQCHGAILAVNSDIEIVDLCHSVDSYDIQLAALMLRGSTGFPKGTVFVAVVDPGVGTERQAIAVRTKAGFTYVGPNNGVFSYVLHEQGLERVVEIDPIKANSSWVRGTFDGRDLFSPAAARIAADGDILKLGKALPAAGLISLPMNRAEVREHKVRGVYLRTDEPYGNVWTNITRDDLTSAGINMGDFLNVQIGESRVIVRLLTSFGNVEKDKPLAYFSSAGTLAFAVNQGNFARSHKVKPGDPVEVQWQEK